MTRKLLLACTGAVLVAAAALADWPCAAEETTVFKIDAAEKAGRLSRDEALMYKFMALYECYRDELPAAYRGKWYGPQPWTCGTPVVAEIRQRWPQMDPAVKRTLQEVCGLGNSQDGLFRRYRRCSWGDSGYGGVQAYGYDTPEGNFKIHYVLEGANKLVDPSDPNRNGIPDCVEKLGADFERAFAQYSRDKWYYHPDPENQKYMPLKDYYKDLEWPGEESDFGGDNRWDVYLGQLTGGVGGLAYADQAFPYTYRDDFSGYMNLRNSYSAPEGGGFGEPVISAHEFMHVAQFMIDIATPSWYLEASAMWGEDTVYPNAGDPRGRMNTYLGNTLRSLDNTGDGGYIACIINFFLRDYCWRCWQPPEWQSVEGNLLPREVWRALAKGDEWYTDDLGVNRGPIDSLDYVIRYHNLGRSYVPDAAFKAVFETWTNWNWFTGPRDDEKHYRWDYSGVAVQNQWAKSELPLIKYEPPSTYLMNHLGHGFYYFAGTPAWPAAIFTFEGHPSNAPESKDWGGSMLVTKNGTTWTDLNGKAGVGSPMFSPGDRGIIQVRNPGQYQGLVMVLNNVSQVGAGLRFNYSVLATEDLRAPGVAVGVARPQANPDYIELLIGGDENLFGAPEASVFFTPRGGEERAGAVTMAGTNRSFIGTFVMEPGENGSGRFVWRVADEAGNIASGEKAFDAGFLSSSGGTVGGDKAFLKLPAGVVAKPTLFSIVPVGEEKGPAAAVAAAAAGDGEAPVETVGPSYEYGPAWARLAGPFEVALSYEGLEVAREDYLSVYRWTGSSWEDLGGTIDKRNRRVSAVADRLGTFVLGYGEKKDTTPPAGKPMSFGLLQNYPNPARDGTVIKFALPERTEVELAVYDLSGRRVATVVKESRGAGVYEERYTLTDDGGKPLPAGVYLYRLTAGSDVATKKMVIAR
jgi:hypothetical protein